ncbi:MAG TPA: alpha/beta fold hydrolase [Candidatus Udaeobacter sp.]|jgi:proline iminopeptidase|nr:alpha/beta fold hydrolase [Candidatus Udaeobacter sp.]
MSTDRIGEPSAAVEEYVEVPGARLYAREIGAGDPLVILHGGPDFNHDYLLPEMDRLSSAFRLIYYDQRGRGRSSAGVEPEDVSLESEIDDLERLRQHFGVTRFAVLGHSWGGLLAMEYATRHADHVSSLILMNTGPASSAEMMRFREERRNLDWETLEKMAAIAATREYGEGDIAVEAEYYRLHFHAASCDPRHVETIVGRLRRHFSPADIVKARAIEDRLYSQTWQAPGYDVSPRLQQLNAPTLVIHGERDLIPLEFARHIADTLPDARLVVLNCGHFAYLERPAGVRDAILSHRRAPQERAQGTP